MGVHKLDREVMPLPRWGTSRDYSRKTDGEKLRRVAQLMGFELFEWQSLVGDVALEKINDEYVFRTVGVAVGRQSGKSKLVSARIAMECLQPNHHVVYTAQDRQMARLKWEEHVDILRSSPRLEKLIAHVVMTNGSERIKFKNRSTYGIATPNRNAARGSSKDLVIIDEALTHPLSLMGALKPTLATRRNGQLWIVSNAGDPNYSELLMHYRTLGHQSISEPDEPLAWFEWAPTQDEFDYLDPEIWRQAIPSLGLRNGVTVEAVREAANMDSPEIFCREWLNVWPAREAVQVVPLEDWDALARTDITVSGRMVLAVAISPERHKASIGVSASVRGLTPVEIVDARDGTNWLVPRVIEVAKRWNAPVVIDGGSPTGSIIGELEQAGVQIITFSGRDYAKACGSFYDAIQAQTITHLGDPILRAAVAESSKRPLGDAWAWNRKKASNITPLEAVTLARYAVTNNPEEKPIQRSRIY